MTAHCTISAAGRPSPKAYLGSGSGIVIGRDRLCPQHSILPRPPSVHQHLAACEGGLFACDSSAAVPAYAAAVSVSVPIGQFASQHERCRVAVALPSLCPAQCLGKLGGAGARRGYCGAQYRLWAAVMHRVLGLYGLERRMR